MYINKNVSALFEGLNIPRDLTTLLGNQVVYQVNDAGYHLSFKTFSVSRHLPIIHEWCNRPYSKQFWGMQGPLKQLKAHYLEKARRFKDISLLIYWDEHPVAFAELYRPAEEVLALHYTAKANDYGLHLLMAPYKSLLKKFDTMGRGFSENILYRLLVYLFSSSKVGRVLAEPDKNNINACRLAEKVGFRFLKEISLPDKKARLYVFERDGFLQMYPRSLHGS